MPLRVPSLDRQPLEAVGCCARPFATATQKPRRISLFQAVEIDSLKEWIPQSKQGFKNHRSFIDWSPCRCRANTQRPSTCYLPSSDSEQSTPHLCGQIKTYSDQPRCSLIIINSVIFIFAMPQPSETLQFGNKRQRWKCRKQ